MSATRKILLGSGLIVAGATVWVRRQLARMRIQEARELGTVQSPRDREREDRVGDGDD